jgi:rhodanese-related sulfurtransferase
MPPTGVRIPRRAVVVAAVLLGASMLVACGDDSSSSTSGAPGAGRASAEAALEQGAIPIDVRTPEEYDGGHVEDAQLIDIQSSGFDDAIAQLDPDATYVVYCRSGNRSAAAADRMEAVGLTVLDGGALGDMSAAGWPTA